MAIRLLMKARVASILKETADVSTLTFAPLDRDRFPPFSAGSNVMLRLRKGLVRQYSLCGDPDKCEYRIAVKREPDGRGGSEHIHTRISEGDDLFVSYPQPDFPLDARFASYIFVAGGIGITPIISFLYSLRGSGKKVTLHYSARKRSDLVFLKEIEALGIDVNLHISSNGERANYGDLFTKYRDGSCLYFCGSAGLSEALSTATAHWPAQTVFSETFTPSRSENAHLGEAFVAEIPRSGHTLHVPENKTLLEVLLQDGVDLDFSCEAGTCRSCIVDIISGDIVHRDKCLSEQERKTLMTPCVSRAIGTVVINSL